VLSGAIALLARIGDGMGVVVGLSSYRSYCEHMALTHPERKAMSRSEFFRARQRDRYGGNGCRCC
jgi:uncharacterized short protein YbdD (DUF466 family)